MNDYVFVNHLGIEHGTVLSPSDERKFWIAHVLEIRARDQQHVYLRVFWCYWPDELPEGRRPYHGRDEVVVSNHMEVIDAMTVAGGASVQHWGEKDTDDKLDGLYWRQTFRFDTQNLSVSRGYLGELEHVLRSLLVHTKALFMPRILQSRPYARRLLESRVRSLAA